MKTYIVWKDDEKELPGIGIANKGDEIAIESEEIAASYVEQGLADYADTAADKPKSKSVKDKEKA